MRDNSPRKAADSGPLTMSGSGVLRIGTPSQSPSKSRVGSAVDLARSGSPAASPSKRPSKPRSGSIWDSLFQVDISYQSSKGRK